MSSNAVTRLAAFLAVFAILFAGSATAADVTLAWDPKVESGVVGYRIHFGTSSRNYTTSTNVGTATTYTVTGLSSGLHYFAVTALYSTGTETAFSNEVSKALTGAIPSITAVKTSSVVSVDGNLSESAWGQSNMVQFSNVAYSDNQVMVKAVWNDAALYLAYVVQDAHREAGNGSIYQDDGAEVYIDAANNKSGTMDANDYHFAVNINSLSSLSGVVGKYSANSGGYSIEIEIPWSLLQTTPAVGKKLGLLLGNNDRDNGVIKQFDWLNLISINGGYVRPDLWGDLILGAAISAPSPSSLPAPTNVTVK